MTAKKIIAILLITIVLILVSIVSYFIVNERIPLHKSTISTNANPTLNTTLAVNKEVTGVQEKNTYTTASTSQNKIVRGHNTTDKSIKVTIVHDKSNPRALNDDFISTNDTHLAIALYYNQYIGGDGPPSKLILEQDFYNIDKLPFLVSITGDLDEIFKYYNKNKYNDEYYITAKVFKHSGNQIFIGDLMNEALTTINPNDTNVEIKVSGVEDCDAPNVGGFCTSRK